MQSVRVLHFFKTFLPDTFGGIEQVIHQLAIGGQAHGIESSVLTLSRAAREEPRIDRYGYEVVRCPVFADIASTPISVSGAFRFKAMARRSDIIHLHFPWPYSDAVSLLSRHGKPVIVTYHSDVIKQERLLRLYRPLMNAFLRRASSLVATSPVYAASSPNLSRWADKVTVIPIGIDESSYPAVEQDRVTAWEQRLGRRFFLFVGVLRYYKGLETLLEAAAEQDFTVAIVGNGGDEAALRQMAIDRGIRAVQFLGKLSDADKVALLHGCAGVVLPSTKRSEAFGISLLEGAMFGKPLVSCEIGTGTSFVNVSGVTGLVVRPREPKALRDALRFLLEHPAEAAVMGQNARRRYETLFTARKMCESYAELYRAVLRQRR